MYYILLDEPFDPSVLDPGNSYPKMFISWLSIDMVNQSIRMGLEFGETDGYGNELKGEWSQTMVRAIEGDSWTSFVSQVSGGSSPMVEDFQQYLLVSLVSNGIVAGTVEYEEPGE